MVNASLAFGFDDDKSDVFQKTLDRLVKNKIETMTAHILTPYPGTKLYKKFVKDKRIIDYDTNNYNTSKVVFQPKHMTPKELYDGYIRIYKKFYTYKNIRRRRPLLKSMRRPYFLFNFIYRKFGKFFSFLGKL